MTVHLISVPPMALCTSCGAKLWMLHFQAYQRDGHFFFEALRVCPNCERHHIYMRRDDVPVEKSLVAVSTFIDGKMKIISIEEAKL